MKISARQIEAFLAMMECGTVNAAAERLRVSQPAISRRLNRFTYEAGFKAFERIGSRLKPTVAAQTYYNEVIRVYQGMDYFNELAKEVRENRRGYLYVGVFPAMSNAWIASHIKNFLINRENVLISVTPMSSPEVISAVYRQTMDIGISVIPTDRSGVKCHELFIQQPVCILPPGHVLSRKTRIHARDLSDQDFISLSSLDSSRTRIDEMFDKLGILRRIRVEVAQASTICHLVAGGVGVSIITNTVAQEYQHLGFEIREFKPKVLFQTYLLRAANRPYSSLCDEFTRQLIRNSQGSLASGGMM